MSRKGPPADFSDQPPLDARIAGLAQRQRGYVTHAQLIPLGLSPSGIKHRALRGGLIRVHHGVYAVGYLPASMVDRAAAAVLACGPGATLGCSSSFTLWGLARNWRQPFEVMARPGHRRPGIAVHRCQTLTVTDRRHHLGIWVTSPARTLLDCAPTLSERQLRRSFNDARIARLITPASIKDLLLRCPRHPGAKHLRELVHVGREPTRSEFEDAFLEFVNRFELPVPEVNRRLGGRMPDMLFPQYRLIVELDGYRFHSDRDAFEEDRERDADHLASGIETVRITWKRLTTRAPAEAARLHAILARRARG